jgi:hypothetical protein
MATNLTRDTQQGLTVRPELVEGWTVNPLMVRQAHHLCPAVSGTNGLTYAVPL